jgi:ketosteroid isomerase-like protein
MRSYLKRYVSAIAVAAALIAPSIASAADLTPAQLGQVSKLANTYFRALVAGDNATVLSITTTDFKGSAPNNKSMETADALVADWKGVKMQTSGLTGGIKVTSGTSDGTTTIANVATQVSANTMVGGQGGSTVSRNALHQLTIVKGADGKWKISQDKILKEKTTM